MMNNAKKLMKKYPTCCIDVLSDNDSFYQANDFIILCNGMRRLPKNYRQSRHPYLNTGFQKN